MARTESAMVALGTVAPPFELLDVVHGQRVSRDTLLPEPGAVGSSPSAKKGLLVMFLCVHCPYVKHIEAELGRLGRDYMGHSGGGPIAIVAIQSNDVLQFPEDGPEGMREQARRCGWTFPYVLDETQEVARAYGAACTPDFFLFRSGRRLVYRGQLDGSRPKRGDFGNGTPVTGVDLRAALDAVCQGKDPDPVQRSSIGCSIKWKGNL